MRPLFLSLLLIGCSHHAKPPTPPAPAPAAAEPAPSEEQETQAERDDYEARQMIDAILKAEDEEASDRCAKGCLDKAAP